MIEDYWILALGVIVVVVSLVILNRRRKINEQVRRIKMANEPGYRPPDDDMDVTIKDGVITYRRRRRK